MIITIDEVPGLLMKHVLYKCSYCIQYLFFTLLSVNHCGKEYIDSNTNHYDDSLTIN